MHSKTHLQQLKLLEKKFLNWRNRKRPGERIPTRLLEEAFDLCNHIKYCKVAGSLGIGHGDFKKRLALYNSSRTLVKSKVETPVFKEIDLLTVNALLSSHSIEIMSPTGHVLRASNVDPILAIEAFLRS